MRKIERVRIGPYQFPVRSMDEDDDDYGKNWGTFHRDEGIRVSPDQEPSRMADTLLHEVLHGIIHVYRLPERMTEEQACTLLAGPLMAFMRDNPVVVGAVMSAADGVAFKVAPPEDE